MPKVYCPLSGVRCQASGVTVMGFGTFDGLHPGHLNYFQQLRKLGGEVIVIVARDANVERIKGRKPLYDEKARLMSVKKCGKADRAFLGGRQDFYRCIRKYKPQILGLGYDQKADLVQLKKFFPDLRIVRLKPYKPGRHKSSIKRGVACRW